MKLNYILLFVLTIVNSSIAHKLRHRNMHKLSHLLKKVEEADLFSGPGGGIDWAKISENITLDDDKI